MPRHAFKFPREVVAAVKLHVRRAIDAVEPTRYRQEPQYTAALVNRLEGVAYEGKHGSVVFHSTDFDDRSRASAEYRLGADFAITATISDGITNVRKAILVQAKLGEIDGLTEAERASLITQITKMKKHVAAPKVMEIVERDDKRFPKMVSGNKVLAGSRYTPMALPEYFTARVTTTFDGCTDPCLIERVQDSSFPCIVVAAKLQR